MEEITPQADTAADEPVSPFEPYYAHAESLMTRLRHEALVEFDRRHPAGRAA